MAERVTRVLVLGGTAWLGGRVARAWRERGAEVVCLARGSAGSAPPGVRLIRADRTLPSAYDEVSGPWDEVIELSYAPDLVTGALRALSHNAAHWTLVSSVSVYERNDEPDAGESADLVEPQDLSQYPDAKVAAERATTAAVGDRLFIARPGLIVGQGDPSDRFGYWMARFLQPGPALVPTTAGRHVQVIDVDDLAAWLVLVGVDGATGVANAVGPPHALTDVLEQTRRAAGFRGEVIAATDDELLAHDVAYWAGPRSLPLWLPADYTGFARRSADAFLASGGATRLLAVTIARTLEDERARGIDRSRRAGLTRTDEGYVVRDIVGRRRRTSEPER